MSACVCVVCCVCVTKEEKKMLLIQRATHQNQIEEACKIAIQIIQTPNASKAEEDLLKNQSRRWCQVEKKQTETECMKKTMNEQEAICVYVCVWYVYC